LTNHHFPARETAAPGARTQIVLDIAQSSLANLLSGVDAVRVWLVERGEGVYSFHATQTVGQSRKQVGEPAVDIMRRVVNSFADDLDGEDVPQRLRDRWDAMVEEYVRLTAPAERGTGD